MGDKNVLPMIDLKPSLRIRPDILIMLLLSLANLILYWPVQNFGFIILDDPAYVLSNPMVQNGLTLDGFKWAFATVYPNAPMWHPLTWLSLMLDRQFYGMNAGGYHWTNLLFHMVNTLLLFFTLRRMTDALWRSAFVAILFALHPLHVESVAWISERKDVLCMFFWLLATWSYLHYIEYLHRRWYFFTLLLFVLALMAKPMAVTFPFVLLLLDYWPLSRFRQRAQDIQSGIHYRIASSLCLQRSSFSLFLEKGPFFIMSLFSSIITFLAQESGEAVQSLINVPLTLRAANAFVAYLTYIVKTVWPHDLAVFYPLPKAWPVCYIFFAFILIVAITATVVYLSKNHPYLFTGWFWYTGTLVPVIGLVQVGSQSMADRYTYIPLTGLFIIVAWGAADILSKRHSLRIYSYLLSASVIGAFIIVSWLQIQYWQNSFTLFKHTLAVTRENFTAHNGMGVALQILGDARGAEFHFKEALRIRPRFAEAHSNLGFVYYKLNELDLATVHLHKAIRISPLYEDAHFNLGHVYLMQKKYIEAAAEYKFVLRVKPDDAEAHNYLGVVLICQNNIEGAIQEFEVALRIQPQYAKARINLFNALEIKKISAIVPNGKPLDSTNFNEISGARTSGKKPLR
jgi:protein O-mannosyl-transferase